MSQSRRKHLGITAMTIVAVLLVFVLHAGIVASKDQSSGEVRMAVDPTVLPAVETEEDLPETVDTNTEQNTQPSDAPKDSQAAQEENITEVVEEPALEEEIQAPPTQNTGQPEEQAGTGTIKSILLDSTNTGFTLTLTADRPVGDTSYMNLANPRRLVIDLRQHWDLRARNVLRAQDGMVKHVVIGEHPDRLRFVIHFRTPPNGNITPEFSHEGNSLTISATQQ